RCCPPSTRRRWAGASAAGSSATTARCCSTGTATSGRPSGGTAGSSAAGRSAGTARSPSASWRTSAPTRRPPSNARPRGCGTGTATSAPRPASAPRWSASSRPEPGLRAPGGASGEGAAEERDGEQDDRGRGETGGREGGEAEVGVGGVVRRDHDRAVGAAAAERRLPRHGGLEGGGVAEAGPLAGAPGVLPRQPDVPHPAPRLDRAGEGRGPPGADVDEVAVAPGQLHRHAGDGVAGPRRGVGGARVDPEERGHGDVPGDRLERQARRQGVPAGARPDDPPGRERPRPVPPTGRCSGRRVGPGPHQIPLAQPFRTEQPVRTGRNDLRQVCTAARYALCKERLICRFRTRLQGASGTSDLRGRRRPTAVAVAVSGYLTK